MTKGMYNVQELPRYFYYNLFNPIGLKKYKSYILEELMILHFGVY